MIIYMSLLAWVVIFSGIAQRARNLENKKARENFAILMVIAGMVYIYAIRWGVGTDFYTYKENYEMIGPRTLEYVKSIGGEWIFNMLVWGIYQLNPRNITFYNAIMGIVIYTIALKTIQKSTDKIFLAILFYMFICYTYAFNGTRQMLAAMVCFAAHKLLLEKKYVPYFILVFIAWKIHSTAIMVLPFFFLGKLPFNNRKLMFIEFAVVILSIFVISLWDKILEFLTFFGFEKLAEDYEDISKKHGASLIRVIVKLPIVVVAIWRFPTLLKNDDDGMLNYYLNMSIFSVIFTIGGLKIVNLTRFSDYFSIYQCLLITKLFKSMDTKDDQVVLNTCMIIGYILMWIVLLHVDSELLPFKLKDGTRFN